MAVYFDPRGLSAEEMLHFASTYDDCMTLLGPEAAPLLLGGLSFLAGGVE